MLFNSYDFIFIFLPACLIAYALAVRRSVRLAVAVLIAFSLIYYGWWNPAYLPLLTALMLINFVFGRLLLKTQSGVLLALAVSLNLLVLAYFKYADLAIRTANEVAGAEIGLLHIVLPLGISFFTFQKIAYLVDCYRRRAADHDLLTFSLFVAFFPQLIAGPIVHPNEVMPQFRRLGPLAADNIVIGLTMFSIGLFKKVVIADHLALIASPVFAAADSGAPLTFVEAWLGVLAYTFQIYFDFSGYSDMAIGLGRLFGVRLPVNFNSPYRATSISEFWRRWHMTLSRFLRDYLYIPLGGNRLGPTRAMINLMIVMLLGGLWHGASWLFVIWGGLHGLYLIVNHLYRRLRPEGETRIEAVLGWALTFFAVVVAWVFFRAATLDGALTMLSAMAGGQGVVIPSDWTVALFLEQAGATVTNWKELKLYAQFDWTWLIAVCFAIVLLFPNSQTLMRLYEPVLAPDRRPWMGGPQWLTWRMTPTWAVFTSLVLFSSLMSLSNVSEFIYYQF